MHIYIHTKLLLVKYRVVVQPWFIIQICCLGNLILDYETLGNIKSDNFGIEVSH